MNDDKGLTHIEPMIVDMRQGWKLPENPFTKVSTETITVAPASAAGEIAYSPVFSGGIIDGYTISGGGKMGAVVLTLTGGQ